MKKTLLAFAAYLLPAMVIAAPPASVKASYEFYRNSILFANVQETFTHGDGKYQIESSATPGGLLELFRNDHISRVSNGMVTSQGLKPLFFEEKRTSGDKERIRSARFDWNERKITLSFDGKSETVALPAGTQDGSSLFYQFLFSTPRKETVRVTVTDGRRVESYDYRFADEAPLTTAAGKFTTLHYVHSDDKGERTTEIWLAKDKSFFPVKLVQEEDGNVTEQRLVALSFD